VCILENYKNGLLHGTRIIYYLNGNRQNVEEWKDNLRVGTSVTYYENGNIESKTNWIDGKIDGVMTRYYDDGVTPFIIKNYKNNKLNGSTTVYSHDGAIILIENYVNGVEVKKPESIYDYIKKTDIISMKL
jgi:antitoxin component YwqK of YwqJK toxin-antitoxin module